MNEHQKMWIPELDSFSGSTLLALKMANLMDSNSVPWSRHGVLFTNNESYLEQMIKLALKLLAS